MIETQPIPKVAIITRTQDRPLFLRRCIASLLAQTFDDWVHVIVNDGGSQAEVDAITEGFGVPYRSRLNMQTHAARRGREVAINTGLKESQSTYVAFLDDDDTWDPEFLEQMVGALEASDDPKVRGAVCQTEIVKETVSENDIAETERLPFNPHLTSILLSELVAGNRFTNNAFLHYRDVYDKIGYFDETIKFLEDWDFNIRFCLHFEAIVVPKMLARWHWRGETSSSSEANSTFAAVQPHELWRARLINEALRGNWLEGQKHLALLSVLGTKFEEQKNLQTTLLRDLQQGLRSELDTLGAERVTVSFLGTLLHGLQQTLRSDIAEVAAERVTVSVLGTLLYQLKEGIRPEIDRVAERQYQLDRAIAGLRSDLQIHQEELLKKIRDASLSGQIRRIFSWSRWKRLFAGR